MCVGKDNCRPQPFQQQAKPAVSDSLLVVQCRKFGIPIWWVWNTYMMPWIIQSRYMGYPIVLGCPDHDVGMSTMGVWDIQWKLGCPHDHDVGMPTMGVWNIQWKLGCPHDHDVGMSTMGVWDIQWIMSLGCPVDEFGISTIEIEMPT
ncbi:hypothetical protein BU15DRAFT_67178 [Melanogaster broomeanus]|nr:hypothetical protein BU15DRAFT_67178 [Melanogaster broomeanus]